MAGGVAADQVNAVAGAVQLLGEELEEGIEQGAVDEIVIYY